jgi:hypothetical protein
MLNKNVGKIAKRHHSIVNCREIALDQRMNMDLAMVILRSIKKYNAEEKTF